ncbi:MAG: NADH peroxidase [Muribaculaceae bacterium]|nr:NADH peroxidase [Muribaculaceae bacterium]
MAKKWICTVCGYVHEGDTPPEKCPLCKQPAEKFKLVEEDKPSFASEHELGIAAGVDPEIIEHLRSHFIGECSEAGQYLAMARQAHREGYPEIGEAFRRYALEEAEHAARYAEMLGEVVWDTKTNLEKRAAAERGACEEKTRIAKLAKAQGLDAIHDNLHEIARDEARHGRGFQGMLDRYFGK